MVDLNSRYIKGLTVEKGELLKKMLLDRDKAKNDTKNRYLDNHKQHIPAQDQYDVIILGGGLAGLTTAIQIKQTRPEASILVVEKHSAPMPEAVHKVGESSVEMSSHYFAETIGMRRHLELDQLPKLGLRFFFSYQDNSDIAQRVEWAGFRGGLQLIQSYQIDRGLFENELAWKSISLGIEFLDDCTVREISLNREGHAITISRAGEEREMRSRWVVDASGRTALLKRKLGLKETTDHNVNAVWFRINTPIDIDDWSEDEEWRKAVFPGLRRFNTNHLMGLGYWVWLIPLSCGSTSVGIVADGDLHKFSTLNRFERAVEWLREHEAQLAQFIDDRRELVQDFRVLKHYAHTCKRVFSEDRWCITGDAGMFLDPLYSIGGDAMAVNNTFTTDLITKDLEGNDIKEKVDFYSWYYLSFMYQGYLTKFQGMYGIMDNEQVTIAKVLFDFTHYWGVNGLLFFQKKLCDLEFMESIRPLIVKFGDMHANVQAMFKEWAKLEKTVPCKKRVDYANVEYIRKLHRELLEDFTDDELRKKLWFNYHTILVLAAEFLERAWGHLSKDDFTKVAERYDLVEALKLKESGVYAEELTDLEGIWIDNAETKK